MFEDRTTLEFPRDGAATLPFLFAPQLVRCVASGPGGAPLHVLIDTGTDPSAVDARLARRLGLPTGGSGFGHGAASDAVQFTESALPWLRLGGLTIRNLFAPILDLSFLPFPVDIVLGYSVLQQLVLCIDYQHQSVTFAHPDLGAPRVSPAGALLPLAFFEHFPALDILSIEGQPIPLATLDTGSNGAVTVGPDLASRLGLLGEGARVERGSGAGFGGSSEVVWRRCRELRLGPFTLADVPIDAHLRRVGDLGRLGRANIGNGLLSRFACVTLDYQRALAGLEPFV